MNQNVRFINKDNSKFFSILKKRVDDYFLVHQISKKANFGMILKTVTLLCAYFLPFLVVLIFNPSLPVVIALSSIMGFAMAGIGMSIMHDANHGAYSSKKWINNILGHTLWIVGWDVHNWKLQHNVLHHSFTNIYSIDEDIDDKTILRLAPHGPVRKMHRYQFIYAFFVFMLSTLYNSLAVDFFSFFRYRKKGLIRSQKTADAIKYITKMTVIKIIYFSTMLVVPCVFFHVSFLHVLTGFLVMHFVAGLTISTIFQLAHAVEETSFPLPNAKNEIENDWAIHQMMTTADFAKHNRLLSWYVGGLNYQIEHHLFPSICHVHYRQIAEIVKKTAEEFKVPYLENKTFLSALGSHIRYLKKLGHQEAV